MRKVNIKLILILSLIFTITMAVNFFLAKEREKLKRMKVEEKLKVTELEKIKVEEKLSLTLTEKEALKEELVQEKELSSILEGQVKEKEKQVQGAFEQIEEKERIINETLALLEQERKERLKVEGDLRHIESELNLASKENETLRQRLKAGALSVPAVELGKIVVTTGSGSSKAGKILNVNKEYAFVIIDLGIDAVEKGDTVSIIREGTVIAKAEVEKVEEKICAATILPEYKEVEIEASDIVRIQ